MAYRLTVNLMCDPAKNSSTWLQSGEVDSTDPCAPVITVGHADACPIFSVSNFSRFFIDNPQILGTVALIFGVIVAIYGRKFFPKTIFTTGTLAGFGITMLLFTMLNIFQSANNTNSKLELTTMGTFFSYFASAAVGIFLGFILQRMLKIGAAIIGFVGGYFIGAPLSSLLLGWIGSEILLSTVSVLFALALAFLSLRHYDNIVIFGTAVLGSYLTVRGFSFFFKGSFPPEAQIFERLASGDVHTLFYIYLAVFVTLTAFGVVVQRRHHD